MPALSGEHDHLVPDRIVFAPQLRERLVQDLVLRRLPQLVLLTQLDGEPDRAVHVLRQEQLGGEVRLAHAPGGVDARREHETDGRGGQVALRHAGLREQALQTDVARPFHSLQTFRDKNAVFAHDGHDVRDRAERDKVGVAVEHRVRVAVERADQLECHTHAREAVERVGVPGLLAVDDRFGLGQLVVALVMVGDDDLHAELARERDLLVRGDARVHGYHQARAASVQLLHRLPRQTVALAQTVRDIIFTGCARRAQVIDQRAGRGDAVDIVVSVDHDALAALDRAANDTDRPVHVVHGERVVQTAARTAEKRPCCGCVFDAAGGKDRRRERRTVHFLREATHSAGIRLSDHPSFRFHSSPSFGFFITTIIPKRRDNLNIFMHIVENG